MKFKSYFFRIAIFSFLFLFISSNTFAAPTFSARYDVGLTEPGPTALIFNNDGTKMYTAGRIAAQIFEYTLTTGFDISDVNIGPNFDQSGEEPIPTGITFNGDGSKLYVVGIGNNPSIVFEYDLTTNYDINTAQFQGNLTEINHTAPSDIKFNNDGTKMYTTDSITGGIEEFDLQTAYDVTSMDPLTSRTNNEVTDQIVDGNLEGLAFSSDGTKMFLADATANTIFSYDLSTAFLITSATYNESFDLTGEIQEAASITFNNDGTMMFITDATSGDIESYTMCPYSLSETPGSCSSESEESEESGGSGSLSDPTSDKNVVASIQSSVSISKNTISNNVNSINSRTDWLRNNKDSKNLSLNNLKFNFSNQFLNQGFENLKLASNNNTSSSKSFLPNGWSYWSEGTITDGKIGDTNTSSSKDIDGSSITFGADKLINYNKVIGFALRHGQDEVKIGSNGSENDHKNYTFSLYSSNIDDNENFIESVIGFSLLETDHLRVSGSNTLNGESDGRQIFSSFNYGRRINKNNYNITPSGRLDFGFTEIDPYSETGTNALSYGRQDIKSGMASLGFKVDNITEFSDKKLKPFTSIDYIFDFSSSSDTSLKYVSSPGTLYSVDVQNQSDHYINFKLGFDLTSLEGLNISSSYERNQGNEGTKSDTISLSGSFKSKSDTEYAFIIEEESFLTSKLNIKRNIKGIDYNFNVNQSLNDSRSYNSANIALSKTF